MVIYLRHGDDRGDYAYKHDRPLKDRGRKKIRKTFKRLIKKYGHPDTIFVSPFSRSLQTLEIMTAQFQRPVAVHCDARVAQYLGDKEVPIVSPETAEAVDLDEGLGAFRARLRDHAESARKRHVLGATIWCITHQIVIEEIAEHFGKRVSRDLDFLDHVVMLG